MFFLRWHEFITVDTLKKLHFQNVIMKLLIRIYYGSSTKLTEFSECNYEIAHYNLLTFYSFHTFD